tara:strand:- start:260 stop:706 length:447 start_codon:yes stop_codon:yes gene_type:complete
MISFIIIDLISYIAGYYYLYLMKIFFLAFLIFSSFIFPSSSFASHVDLKPCIEVAHCVREEWDVNNIEEPFEEIKSIIENTPRTKIVEINGDYLHAEATSKWMKYVDDLEVSFVPDSNILLIRSESRVGDSDLGVNKKRVDLLKSKMF